MKTMFNSYEDARKEWVPDNALILSERRVRSMSGDSRHAEDDKSIGGSP
jgi:hypothetical protein